MFCEQCGMKLEEGTRFCPGCGCRVGDEVMEAAETVRNDGSNITGQYNESSMNGHYNGPDVNGQGNGSAVQVDPGGNIPNPKKSKKTMILIGAAAAAMLLVVGALAAVLAVTFFGGPRMKVARAVASTVKDTPKLVNDLKVVSSVLAEEQYTAGIELEIEDANIKAEFRNAKNDKQVYMNADLYDYGDIDVLYGVHSGILKASLSDLNYVFFYDPKADNDGFLCEQIREECTDKGVKRTGLQGSQNTPF